MGPRPWRFHLSCVEAPSYEHGPRGEPMRAILLCALPFLAVSPVYAADFSFERNHCAAGEYRPKEPKSGGIGGLLDSTAWAETGICMKIPIAKLQAAAADLGVMTW